MTRREMLLTGAAAGALLATGAHGMAGAGPGAAEPFPLSAVRLTPSIFLDAVEANRRYLMALEPDRLLHNFRTSARLAPTGEVYGGWESRGIAGHTLGHYLSALSLLHAQTGDAEAARRARAIVGELAECQAAHGDGYVGGTTVERDGREVDGKIVFEEVRRGEIRSGGFDLNEGWVPLYTWHKVHAGLLDAHAMTGDPRALKVAVGMCRYLAGVFDRLDDAQMQRVLAAEHGGLNETFAETYARTGDRRWLAVAERIHHDRVLDPIEAGRDALKGLHANTQIPKVIGLARLHELTGTARYATAAGFFWNTVTKHHSYVIGGNSEREHFGTPDMLAGTLTEMTCEACNSYNMLKLTRHLYAWRPDAAYFDYYERAHLNHIMAHQDPATGMLVYMMPMMAGARRVYSTPTGDFWCCVGSGIESHAKHGESVWWKSGDMLRVNLFVPSTLDWADRDARLALETRYPLGDTVELVVTKAGRLGPVALRIPGWCTAPRLAVNGATMPIVREGGYAMVRRRWRDGDRIALTLPSAVRSEALPGAPDTIAFLDGPVVLAADLGPADAPFDRVPPALVAADPVGALRPVAGSPRTYATGSAGRPEALTLRPFFSQYQRRTAVYLPSFDEPRWAREEATFLAAQRERKALEARTIDVMHLGEMQPERDHVLKSAASELVSYLGRAGRVIRPGGFVAFTMATRPGATTIRITEWGENRSGDYRLLVDDVEVPLPPRPTDKVKAFTDSDFPLPAAMLAGKRRVTLRIEPQPGKGVTLYGVRLMADARPAATAAGASQETATG